MTKFVLWASFLAVVSCGARAERLTLTVRVQDADGELVTNAEVVVKALNRVGLNAGAFPEHFTRFSSPVDSNGVAKVVFDTPVNYVDCWCFADGYYSDSVHFVKYKARPRMLYWADFLEREKELSVVLYRKKHPDAMYSYRIHTYESPKGDGRYGFDLKKCDWVAPWGHGDVADFYYEKKADSEDCVLSFDENCGAYKEANEGPLNIPSTYCAKTNAQFSSSLRLSGMYCDGWRTVLNDDEYIVIRSRVTCDEKGRVIKANYSKIDGPLSLGDWIRFRQSVFNPNVNDANLESDLKRNLARGRFRIR